MGLLRGSGGPPAACVPESLVLVRLRPYRGVGSIVATGAELHAAADFIQHRSALGPLATVLAVAVTVGVYIGAVYATYLLLTGAWDGIYEPSC